MFKEKQLEDLIALGGTDEAKEAIRAYLEKHVRVKNTKITVNKKDLDTLIPTGTNIYWLLDKYREKAMFYEMRLLLDESWQLRDKATGETIPLGVFQDEQQRVNLDYELVVDFRLCCIKE